MKMEPIERSETLAFRTQMPGEIPKRKHTTNTLLLTVLVFHAVEAIYFSSFASRCQEVLNIFSHNKQLYLEREIFTKMAGSAPANQIV